MKKYDLSKGIQRFHSMTYLTPMPIKKLNDESQSEHQGTGTPLVFR